MGIFARIKKAWYDSIIWETIDEDFYDELEESLIMADLGAAVAADAVKELRKVVYEKSIQRGDDVKQALRDILEKKLEVGDTSLDLSTTPSVVLIIGVNGVGKTTTIGKLAYRLKHQRAWKYGIVLEVPLKKIFVVPDFIAHFCLPDSNLGRVNKKKRFAMRHQILNFLSV